MAIDLNDIIIELQPHLDHPDPVIALLVKSVREIATHLRDQSEYQTEQLERNSE